MSNFKNLLSDILLEQQKSYQELEDAGVLGIGTYYEFAEFSPYLKTVIDIANYLEVSIDYLADRTNENKFRRYKYPQTNISTRILSIMESQNKSQRQLQRETKVSRTNFVYWRRGVTPKFDTLVILADYLNCNIDDFMEFE